MTNYPIGDFLIRIGNAAIVGKEEIRVASTKLIKEAAIVLKKAGYLAEIEEKKGILTVRLAIKNKKPVLMRVKLVSRPGLRIYMGANEISKKKGPSKYLLTTPKGILLSNEAAKENVGGEVIAEII